jgi:hypothetical protein
LSNLCPSLRYQGSVGGSKKGEVLGLNKNLSFFFQDGISVTTFSAFYSTRWRKGNCFSLSFFSLKCVWGENLVFTEPSSVLLSSSLHSLLLCHAVKKGQFSKNHFFHQKSAKQSPGPEEKKGKRGKE